MRIINHCVALEYLLYELAEPSPVEQSSRFCCGRERGQPGPGDGLHPRKQEHLATAGRAAYAGNLGIALVTRVGRGIELTASGARLARDLELGFDTISRGVSRVNEEAAVRPVQVTMSPAFAVE